MRFPPLTPLVKAILLLLTGTFIAQLVLTVWMNQAWPLTLVLYPEPGIHSIWQIATYPLMHGGSVGEFLLALVFFWWVVSPFESTFGRPHTLRLLAFTTVGAALPVLVFGLFFGDGGESMSYVAGPVVAGPVYSIHVHILAAIAAFAWSMRFRGTMSFFGVLPLSAKQILLVVAALSALHFLATKNVASLLADLGAIGSGIAFVEWLSKPDAAKAKKKRPNPGGLHVIRGEKDDDPPRWLN